MLPLLPLARPLLLLLLCTGAAHSLQPSAAACMNCATPSTASATGTPSQGPTALPTLLPLFCTLFNLREAAKQLLLLEDHLSQPERRCDDCIRKHFLKAEALLEEGATLTGRAAHKALSAEDARLVCEQSERWLRGAEPADVTSSLRTLRKYLVQLAFDLSECARQ
jgi:hypothetical protein